ncbi:Transmembrane domain-containing protein [Spironucleus salmonicida]|uniref:Transmembrane domain-containing protein n=1 Tax=Spironucleus salmonicida TaxID=348837 RepID=V6LBA0_9EUKA|nr:Transmembrane domain-containing protein [Spironucleus salmonicida]|eukprot:EST41528.1 Transmembrane domain-containing protein [Spironucleus salmonicida]
MSIPIEDYLNYPSQPDCMDFMFEKLTIKQLIISIVLFFTICLNTFLLVILPKLGVIGLFALLILALVAFCISSKNESTNQLENKLE